MSRPGYTNLGPSKGRTELFEVICNHLAMDPEQSIARVVALDYALRVAAREIRRDEMPTVKLDRGNIEKKIWAGDTCNGHHALAIAPDGSDHAVHWMEQNRQWGPWPEGWLIIGIPALNPEGVGAEWERALELLSHELGHEQANQLEKELTEQDKPLVKYVEEQYSKEWETWNGEEIDWLVDAFIQACNGDGGDLNDPTPWGHTPEEDGYEAIDPPAKFEWA